MKAVLNTGPNGRHHANLTRGRSDFTNPRRIVFARKRVRGGMRNDREKSEPKELS